ncbi:nucleotidyltransferase family protein, partial [Streptomyces sp. NPDC049099]|uniref:nucleotidyltransferase family protein n=1 Tax=Streptomyces sp. NPDC049099 TaxID=3155768 RepID=UPI0034414D5D
RPSTSAGGTPNRHAYDQWGDVLTEVLSRAATLELPGWYVTAGCPFQIVWNVVTGRPPTSGIKDYDFFCFDGGDLYWEAEDTVLKAGRKVFAGLPAEVGIRNEARVHLSYQDKFGLPCPPYDSTEAAIDSFAATTCCLGIRVEVDGRWLVHAPHGLSDVFNLVVRPNPMLAPRALYEISVGGPAPWRMPAATGREKEGGLRRRAGSE